MPRAIWNGAVLAESDRCETVENNCYFPPDTSQTRVSQTERDAYDLSMERRSQLLRR
jgi:hypothetical protein